LGGALDEFELGIQLLDHGIDHIVMRDVGETWILARHISEQSAMLEGNVEVLVEN